VVIKEEVNIGINILGKNLKIIFIFFLLIFI